MEVTSLAPSSMEHLDSRGGFLTTQFKDKLNTMAIAWGSIGYAFDRPTLTVMVRESCFTAELLGLAGEFTVSIPFEDTLRDAILFCGRNSGRHMNKLESSGLTVKCPQTLQTPIIHCHGAHYECKIITVQPLNVPFINKDIQQEHTSEHDKYLWVIGEIVASYII